jgi:hypothetical protein
MLVAGLGVGELVGELQQRAGAMALQRDGDA